MANAQSDWDITVEDLARLREEGADFFLLDVREPHEVAIATLGGVNIPLARVAQSLADIPRDRKVVVHCKLGGRSAKAVVALRQLGYDDVWNVAGGITAWSERIAPDVPTC